MMEQREYGNTGLMLSAVGLGAGQIGDAALSEQDVEKFLNAALDAGVTFIDTAPSYGLSEARIGRCLGHRRHEFVLSTKLGYGVDGVADWTGECITQGVEKALHVLRTEYLDIAHLHSCPKETLQHTDVIDALARAKVAGKIRAIAYSGENEDLAYAIECGRFDGFMASLNICDQRVIDEVFPLLQVQGKGFVAKRPMANVAWRYATTPSGNYAETYWHRFHAMGLDPQARDWAEASLRFALSLPVVASAAVGTASLLHLQQSVEAANRGALDAMDVAALRTAFAQHDENWHGQI
jgi:aryl-alcohol dehydrogenase-like predicted oxidoreductase